MFLSLTTKIQAVFLKSTDQRKKEKKVRSHITHKLFLLKLYLTAKVSLLSQQKWHSKKIYFPNSIGNEQYLVHFSVAISNLVNFETNYENLSNMMSSRILLQTLAAALYEIFCENSASVQVHTVSYNASARQPDPT